MNRGLTADATVVVYGALWCPDCRRAKDFLTTHHINFEWMDIEEHPELVGEVQARNGGHQVIPTIVFPDGSHVSEPSDEELVKLFDVS
ncbi:MAG: NrdH-redoxin [Acidimicrobiaceae bacterium]|nr:NrdH-redoxin [Acidimicrobiaceae bacterium]